MSGKRQWKWHWHLGSPRCFREPNFVQGTERCILGGAQRTTHEAKQRDCPRLVHLRLYGHVGVFTGPLPGTGCVLGSRY